MLMNRDSVCTAWPVQGIRVIWGIEVQGICFDVKSRLQHQLNIYTEYTRHPIYVIKYVPCYLFLYARLNSALHLWSANVSNSTAATKGTADKHLAQFGIPFHHFMQCISALSFTLHHLYNLLTQSFCQSNWYSLKLNYPMKEIGVITCKFDTITVTPYAGGFLLIIFFFFW